MIDWLLAPVDLSRPHDLDMWTGWHGRLMVLAWGVCCPLGVLVARFGKILPRQDWPRQIDSRIWWYGHLALQYTAGIAALIAIYLIVSRPGGQEAGSFHARLGWCTLTIIALQFLAGWLRGSKGGPTEPTLAGDHYDMTKRRLAFEYYHKFAGYLVLLLVMAGVASGLWFANAPNWMWLTLGLWWLFVILMFFMLQKRGLAYDTYQAIWGPDTDHPGNRRNPVGLGINRQPKRR